MGYGQSVVLLDYSTGKPANVNSEGKLEVTTEIGFSGDIQLGAVEIKDGDTNLRAKVEELNSKNHLYVQGYELDRIMEATKTISGDNADIKAGIQIMDDWDESDRAKVNPIVGQAGVAAGDGNVGANVTRVVSAKDGVYETQMSGDSASIKTAVELIDDAIGTIDSAFSGKVMVEGGKAESTVPTEVADGDAVAKWFDTFGRQILYGANLGIGALDVNEVAPALQQTMEVTLLDAVTATGDSAVVDVSNYNKLTFHEIASGVSTGAALVLRHSLDNTNFAVVNSGDITANGVTEVAISDRKYKYVKANIASRTDGTYSVLMLAGN